MPSSGVGAKMKRFKKILGQFWILLSTNIAGCWCARAKPKRHTGLHEMDASVPELATK